MTEGYFNIGRTESDDELESAAVAGAAAIQSLIADRNNLRNQLATSRAAEEELRMRLVGLHQRYLELAKNVVSELQHFDSKMRDSVHERPEVTGDNVTSTPPSMKQFNGSGLPVGANGVRHRNGEHLIEP